MPRKEDDRTLSLFGGNGVAPAARRFVPTTPDGADRNKQVVRDLRSLDALFGRVTYYAGPSQARYSSYPGTGITPEQIWNLQLLRNTGYPQLWVELTEQTMERDGSLGGIAETRRLSVADKDFRLHPAKRGDSLSELVCEATERAYLQMDDFDQTVEDLLSAPAYGYAIGEVVWRWGRVRVPLGRRKSVTIPVKLPGQVDWVHWKHVRFDRYTDEPYLWIGTGGDYTFPPHKFVFHRSSGSGLVEKRGYMGSCNWLAAAKRWTERDWLVYGKLFGIPQIIARYPNGVEEYDLHRQKYVQFLKDWGEGIPALLPDELEFEITREPAGRAGDIHGSIIGWANQEMMKRILGSTLTVEMGNVGSWAAADVHRDAPYMRARADAKKLAGTLRRDLWAAFVEENVWALASAFGADPEELPYHVPRCSWRIEREMSPRDRHAVYEGAVNELGLEVDEEQYRDEFGFDRPRRPGEHLQGRLEVRGEGEVLEPTATAANDPDEEPLPSVKPEENGGAPAALKGRGRPNGGIVNPPFKPRPALSRDTKEVLRRFVEGLPSHQRFEMLPVVDSL